MALSGWPRWKTRREVEAITGKPVVSPVNYKTLRQERQRELQPSLLDSPPEDA